MYERRRQALSSSLLGISVQPVGRYVPVGGEVEVKTLHHVYLREMGGGGHAPSPHAPLPFIWCELKKE